MRISAVALTACLALSACGVEPLESSETPASGDVDLSEFDATKAACSHSLCATGTKLVASCDPCAAAICAADSYCCRSKWDRVCVGEVSSICELNTCSCTRQCEGKECGDDGCGGTCGQCDGANETCSAGQCSCTPSCQGKHCGDDGCGGTCGECDADDESCVQGECVCAPKCEGKQCGNDGCGGSCGTCDGQSCDGSGHCVCTPDCSGRECGDNGCGGSCGTCSANGESCSAEGQCVGCSASCEGKECGDDGCGGSCGTCQNQTCSSEGQCVGCIPDCSGKTCGDDGCGGSCGTCPVGQCTGAYPAHGGADDAYSAIENLRDAALAAELQKMTKANHHSLGYTSAKSTLFGSKGIDVHNGKVECIYSGALFNSSQLDSNKGFNTEHSWPQSEFAGEASTSKADMHHLFATESHINSCRSNLPYGETDNFSAKCSVNGSGNGPDVTTGKKVFTVRPSWRGDVARAHFYFAVRYKRSISAEEEAVLRCWHMQDAPDDQERARNDAVAARQGNRNPFVDRPEFVGYISDF